MYVAILVYINFTDDVVIQITDDSSEAVTEKTSLESAADRFQQSDGPKLHVHGSNMCYCCFQVTNVVNTFIDVFHSHSTFSQTVDPSCDQCTYTSSLSL